MEVEVAQWLVSDEAAPYRESVRGLSDPTSLKAGADLRRDLAPDRAAAVLELETLRRKGRAKLSDLADSLYLTREGLEQATRWEVAQWRARRLTANMAEVGIVLDVGCGLGIDSLGFQEGGWDVISIEKDPVTAVFAQANLCAGLEGKSGDAKGGRVIQAALEDVDISGWLADSQVALFLDPARRTSTYRSWDVADLSPSWDTVLDLVRVAAGPVVVKLGPGFPHTLIPEEADVTWLSHHGDLVETTLWFPGTGRRAAVLLGDQPPMYITATDAAAPSGPLGEYIYEPDPAITRAHATGDLCRLLGAHRVADSIAYLTSNTLMTTPFAQAFHVEEVMDHSEKTLRTWVRSHNIGALEIKTRGLNVDPATLRRTLKPTGSNTATLILTPTAEGTKALVVTRVPA